jgi:hypothetical protein
MADARIDRLTLRLAGLAPADGKRLAQAVADALADARLAAATGDIGSLRVRLAARPGVPADRLAEEIVAEVVRAANAKL